MRVVLMIVGLSGWLVQSALAGDPPQRTVSASGSAVVYFYDAPPDVMVTVSVEKNDVNAEVATEQMDQADKSLRKAFKDLGIDDKDIHATPPNIQINYIQSSSSFIGAVDKTTMDYHTARNYMVRIKDSGLLGQFVDAAMKNGANQVSDFRYDAAAFAKYRAQVRAMAIEAAKEKAAGLAHVLGCERGNPIAITEAGEPTNNGVDNFVAMGQWSFQSSVNVTFELKDAAAK
jgi:uncharacterized protein YggE